MPSSRRICNWILLLAVNWLLQCGAGRMADRTAGQVSGLSSKNADRIDRQRTEASAVNSDYFKSDNFESDGWQSDNGLHSNRLANVGPGGAERKRRSESASKVAPNLSRANATLSFTNAEPLPISKGQTLRPSPSRKEEVTADSPSLSNRLVNGASVPNSTVSSLSLSNDVNKFETLAPLATKSAPSVNSFIQNDEHADRRRMPAKTKRDMHAGRQFSRTRRRSSAAQFDATFDDQVIRFYREQKSINMAGHPKLYEMLLKSKRSSDGVESITIGAILPKTALITKFRSYQKRLQDAVEDLMGSKNGVFHFLQRFRIAQAQLVLLSRNPTPTEILAALCDKLLPHNVSTIIYMSNSDTDDSNAASALYLMQLTSYLGIPSRCSGFEMQNFGFQSKLSKVDQLVELLILTVFQFWLGHRTTSA